MVNNTSVRRSSAHRRYLVVGAQLLAVGREGEQPAGGIHHAADLQPVVVADLPGAHALARTHHVAVAAFDAEFQKQFYLCTTTGVTEACRSRRLNLNYAAQATSSCCGGGGARGPESDPEPR